MEQSLQTPNTHVARDRFPIFSLAWAFMLFWWSLGIVLLVLSCRTATGALGSGPNSSPFVALLAGVEAASALFFMLPRAQRLGAAGLLLTLLITILVHATNREFRWDLILYAAAVLLVAVRGPMSKNQLEGNR